MGLNVRHPWINLHNQAVLVRNSLIRLLEVAVENLLKKIGFSSDLNIDVEVEPPKQADHGHFATNFCLVASKQLGQNPRALAEMLVEAIREADATQLVTEIEIAGPGFINFRLSPTQVAQHISTVLAEGDSFGSLENPSPEKINVEFVSVNPNGPITIGSGRGAAFGSALCNVLEAAGNIIHREYYINDGVNSEQMRLFAESVKAIIEGREVPENGYKGDYVYKTAQDFFVQSRFQHQFGTDLQVAAIHLRQPTEDESKLKSRVIERIDQEEVENFASDFCGLVGLVAKNKSLTDYHFRSSLSQEAGYKYFLDCWLCFFITISGRHLQTISAQLSPYMILSNSIVRKSFRSAFFYSRANTPFAGIPDVPPDLAQSLGSEFENIKTTAAVISDLRFTESLLEGVGSNFMISASSGGGDFKEFISQVRKELPSISDADIKYLLHEGGQNLGIDNAMKDSLVRNIVQHIMVDSQKSDLQSFQTDFDTWFSEQSLHDSGEVENTLHHLLAAKVADDKPYRTKVVMAKGGIIKEVLKEEQPSDEEEADSAEVPPTSMGGGRGGVEPAEKAQEASKTIWLRSTKFGDDQDRVLKRKDGRLTYIASDVAYHKDKFSRPADGNKLITVLGPDHHGYIARLTAVVAAMFSDQVEPLNNQEPLTEHEALIYDSIADRNQCQAALAWAKEHLQVQIFQIVRFLKDGKPAPMRKRDGNIYALIDLVNEIGAVLRPNGTEAEKQQAGSDVARFFYLMRHHDTAMDFDLELATKQSDENPVFYVQYAHARISSVIEKAKEQEFDAPSRVNNPGLLNHPKEIALILKICDLPHEVERTAKDYSVNRLTTYAIELARTYHSFYDSCRVIQSDQPELTLARLALCQATRIALKNALNLLGVSAPERMDRAVSN